MRTRSIGVVTALVHLCVGLSCSAPANRPAGAADARDDAIELVDLSALQAADPAPATPPGFSDLHSTAANACARTMTGDVSGSRRDPPAVLQSGSVVQLMQRKGDRVYKPTTFLPRSLRARAPDAVRHVVCILETESQVGVYVAEGTNQSVKPAMQTGWDIAILTWPAGRIVDAQLLWGQLPPARILSSGANAPGSPAPGGSPLLDQARDFLLRRLHPAKSVMEKPEWTQWSLAAAFSPDVLHEVGRRLTHAPREARRAKASAESSAHAGPGECRCSGTVTPAPSRWRP